MPIMATQTQNDARGSARILAETAVSCLRNRSLAQSQEVALNNVYRLLEAYRANAFFGVESPAKDYSTLEDDLYLSPLSETYITDVKEAIDDACARAFSQRERDSAIELVESVLRYIVYPASFPAVSEESQAATEAFFERIVEKLTIN